MSWIDRLGENVAAIKHDPMSWIFHPQDFASEMVKRGNIPAVESVLRWSGRRLPLETQVRLLRDVRGKSAMQGHGDDMHAVANLYRRLAPAGMPRG